MTNDSAYTYDVAVSFAGTERPLAQLLAHIVRDAGFRVFYDDFYPEKLWGEELPVTLDEMYRKQARFCVIFKSQEYLTRMWTNHERKSAVARALQDRGQAYLLPIQVEDVELPGVVPTIGYLSLDEHSIEEIARILIAKLRGTSVTEELTFGQESEAGNRAVSDAVDRRMRALVTFQEAKKVASWKDAQKLATDALTIDPTVADVRSWLGIRLAIVVQAWFIYAHGYRDPLARRIYNLLEEPPIEQAIA